MIKKKLFSSVIDKITHLIMQCVCVCVKVIQPRVRVAQPGYRLYEQGSVTL
jgi:hypothetical protein